MVNLTLLAKKLLKVDTSGFPRFETYDTPLEMSLWVLWVCKEKLGVQKLGAEEIATLIRNVKEKSITKKSIVLVYCPT